jgi:type I restriction enzyme R subunit
MESSRTDWEAKRTFLHFLYMKLPKLGSDDDPTEGLLELVDFDKYRVIKQEEKQIKLANQVAEIEPIPVATPRDGGVQHDPDMETLDKIVEAFNDTFGGVTGVDSDILQVQARKVGEALLANDNVRDTLLNNDEGTQLQVVRDKTKQNILEVTQQSNELQEFYLHNPGKQAQLDSAMLMLLQGAINPEYNEVLIREKITEDMADDFQEVCGSNKTTIDEIVETLFKVLNAETLPNLDGLKQLCRTLNLYYRTNARIEDCQEWLQLLVGKFEAYLKKIYYLREGDELKPQEPNGKVQFLDAARATWVNTLHFSDDKSLAKFKQYYEFLHSQRNEQSHGAPVIPDDRVKCCIHMTVAMYLYATLINQNRMKTCGLAE